MSSASALDVVRVLLAEERGLLSSEHRCPVALRRVVLSPAQSESV